MPRKPAAKTKKKSGNVPRRQMKSRPRYSLAEAGASAGGVLGKLGDNMLTKLLGSGDYSVRQNTILAPDSVPYMHTSDNSIRVAHKEFICNIEATTDFSLQSFAVNPALAATFPFLSSLAQNYEQYQILGMCFYFKSTSADALNSTNTALGSVILASDYNSASPNFVTKQGMEATTFSSSGRPSSNIIHPIECDVSMSSGPALRYCRSGAVPSGQDIRLYDWCNTQIASVGVQATSMVGELHVAYDVILRNPQLTVPRGLNISFSQFFISSPSNSAPLSGATAGYNTLGVFLTNNEVINFPANTYGKYNILLHWGGNSGVAAPTCNFNYNNCRAIPLYNNNQTSIIANNTAESTSQVFSIQNIEIINPLKPSYVVLQGVQIPAAAVSTVGDLVITKINGNLTGAAPYA
jgi:hypothetical protein